jgi:hypothetical protein
MWTAWRRTDVEQGRCSCRACNPAVVKGKSERVNQHDGGNNMKRSALLLSATICLVLSTTSLAGEYMSADAVKSLLTGKTADGKHHKKDFSYSIYFDPAGTLIRVKDGETRTGKWRVDDEGKHCVTWDDEGKQRCFPFKDNGDGTISKYRLIDYSDDIKIITLSNIRKGNRL